MVQVLHRINRSRAAIVVAGILAMTGLSGLGPERAAAAGIPSIGIGDVSLREGDTGGRTALVPVTLSEPSSAPVTVAYTITGVEATAGTTQTPGADFNDKGGRARQLTFKPAAAGVTPVVKFVSIPLYPDAAPEGDERVRVTLSGPSSSAVLGRSVGTVTVVDDDPVEVTSVSVGDLSVVEGHSGRRVVKVPVTLSAPATTDVSVTATIVAGTATGGFKGGATAPGGVDVADRLGASTTIRFARRATGTTPVAKVIAVSVYPDTTNEADETFAVVLSNPIGAVIADGTGTGTVLDDDPAIATSIGAGSSQNPSREGEPVTFSASMMAASGQPAGTVEFRDGAAVLGTADLVAGSASFTTPNLVPGVHEITAAYRGSPPHAPSTSAVISQTVRRSTTTTLTASPNPTPANLGVLLNATVSAGSGTPTGSVTFLDGSDVLGTAPVFGNGVASTYASFTTTGSHPVVARYDGDDDYAGSESLPLPVGVDLAASEVTLTSSQNPSVSGDPVALTASVNAPGIPGPTGSVTFYDAGTVPATVLGTAPVGGGAATVTINGFRSGGHRLYAAYSGDATHVGSGDFLDQTVTSPVVAVSGGGYFTCALLAEGSVRCWGANAYGMLGDGTTTTSTTPVAVIGITDATAISSGTFGACALRANGRVVCWGRLATLLGENYTIMPTEVPGITTATAISMGDHHACAVITGGTVQCWGKNSQSELGNGTITDSATPVTVPGLSNVASVSVGQFYSCARRTGGAVWCWGANDTGQQGSGTTLPHSTPFQASLSDATALTTGLAHACAAVTSGLAVNLVLCWGANSLGQLGYGGSGGIVPQPITTAGPQFLAPISAGWNQTCGLRPDGTARCWGSNSLGQLGNGTTVDSATAVVVTGLTGGTAISSGGYHTCAVVTGGNVRCWGANEYGQLGNGGTTASSTPTTVTGL